MAVFSFLLKGQKTSGIIREILNFIIILVLLVKHYQEYPYKSKYIQKISGGLLLWLYTVSFPNVLDISL